MSALIRSPRKQTTIDAGNPHRRVILLLDMDCFYAQCETVRLGLDQSIPLALLQWNSALAVNYPAREFGIKRGDSFEVIQEKSKGECISIHLPVTPVNDTLAVPAKTSPPSVGSSSSRKVNAEDGAGDNEGGGGAENFAMSSSSARRGELSSSSHDDDVEVASSQTAYDEEFNQPKDIQEEMYRTEKNKMRSPSEGKACLDRYRLASSRIFSLIDETLAENLGRNHFTLERASIDELFIDVTAFCSRVDEDNSKEYATAATIKFCSDCDTNAMQSLKETVVCHEASVDSGEKDDETGKALRLGCYIALTVRRTVCEKLGFTLSAGISTSKLVSKLAASFGKPDGQAIIFPGAMANVMEETPIRKARMLGGKLGKKVQSLLPDSETTMGSVSRMLPLDILEKAIGQESGRWVFDACRGIDFEEVKPTLNVLPKSITAFKSFPKMSYPELEKWTALLAREVMKRVETDKSRNNRIPKSVTVGYTMCPGGAWIARTFRLPFPTDRDFDSGVKRLVENTQKILTERGHSSFIRIGYSAIDFVPRPRIGIDSYFRKAKTLSSSSNRLDSGESHVKKERDGKSGGIDSYFPTRKNQQETSKSRTVASPKLVSPHESSQKQDRTIVLQQAIKGKVILADNSTVAKTNSVDASHHITNMADEEIARQLQNSYDNETREEGKYNDAFSDRDKALAYQLQSSYDREHAVLTHVERFSVKRSNNSNTKSKKRSKMDYFLKK